MNANCAVCGLPLRWSDGRPIHVRRYRALPVSATPVSATVADMPPSATLEITSEAVCGDDCAKRLRERWQNEDLAADICDRMGLPADATQRYGISLIIREHREKW